MECYGPVARALIFVGLSLAVSAGEEINFGSAFSAFLGRPQQHLPPAPIAVCLAPGGRSFAAMAAIAVTWIDAD